MASDPAVAVFSDCRAYRYTLWREVGMIGEGFVQFIGLNPSTADERNDDPTIRRCVGFARSLGANALCMTNLFAFRATDPRVMIAQPDPVGEHNDIHLLDTAFSARIVIAAWGIHGSHSGRAAEVLRNFRSAGLQLQCLGTNQDGSPRHPLYVPAATLPVPFSMHMPADSLAGPCSS